jgi:hypothetical protein
MNNRILVLLDGVLNTLLAPTGVAVVPECFDIETITP